MKTTISAPQNLIKKRREKRKKDGKFVGNNVKKRILKRRCKQTRTRKPETRRQEEGERVW